LQEYYQTKDQSRWTVILPNYVALIEAAHAILWLGGVFCPVNHQLPVQDFAHALSLTQSEYLIAYGPLVAKVKEAIGLAKRKHHGFQTPQVLVALAPDYSSSYRDLYENIRYDKILPVPHYNNTERRLTSIHLSSGTTGLAKGVKISHLNYIANVHQLFAHDPER
jgi:acyl-CoA synthetase (AMP-forming)/AMP-acid ligase II